MQIDSFHGLLLNNPSTTPKSNHSSPVIKEFPELTGIFSLSPYISSALSADLGCKQIDLLLLLMNSGFHSEIVASSTSCTSPLRICGIAGFTMSPLWTPRWDSFVDQPFVTHVETILFIYLLFYMFDGVMAMVGQIWVEGQCHKKDKKLCCPKVLCSVFIEKRETILWQYFANSAQFLLVFLFKKHVCFTCVNCVGSIKRRG